MSTLFAKKYFSEAILRGVLPAQPVTSKKRVYMTGILYFRKVNISKHIQAILLTINKSSLKVHSSRDESE